MVPISPWRVDYADAECRLFREFAFRDQRITLRIAQVSSSLYDFAVAGRPLAGLRERPWVTMRLDPQAVDTVKYGYSMQVPGQNFPFLRTYDLESSFVQQMQAEQQLAITTGTVSIRLRINNAPQAFAALQACYDDLLHGWGVDLASTQALMRRAEPSNDSSTWVTNDDYPDEELRQEGQGTVAVLLTVGTEGRVIACRVVGSSGSRTLDAASCRLLTLRARFRPALGQDGQPSIDYFSRRLRWNIAEF